MLELTRRFDSDGRAGDVPRAAPSSSTAALDELDPDVRVGLDAGDRERASASREAELSGDLTRRACRRASRSTLRELPVRRAGAYVPGGRAAYPSSVVMCCVPARVAGVEEIAVATPPGPDGAANPRDPRGLRALRRATRST